MKCPNCAQVNVINNICPSCGVDAVLFKQTSIISCNLYNKGLEQAQMRDLTGAITLLNKSIEFNKNNIPARNLLGLLYFEVGYIGDALKHWIISSSLIKENNEAVNYIDRLQKNSRQLDQLGDAVKIYNQALEYLKQKNDDMAIIQLKKALEINPVFLDALNLLAFCYLIQKDKDKAKMLVEKVLALDINNAVALRYYNELFPAKIRPEPKKLAKLQANASQAPRVGEPRRKKSFGEGFHLTEILSFLIGLIVSFALLYILVMPGAVAASQRDLAALRNSLNEAEARLALESVESRERIDELEFENRNLRQENETLSAQARLRNLNEIVTRAQAYINAGDFGNAAQELRHGGNFNELPEEIRRVALGLVEEAYPQASRLFWQEAITAYNAADYNEARRLLDLSLEFGAATLGFYDSVLFYSGSLAERDSNPQLAAIYFQRIITDHPRSTYATQARNRFNNLN